MASDVIEVDPGWLEELAGRVEAVSAELSRAVSAFDGTEAAVGHPRVAEALGSFDDSWSQKRGQLVESLGQAARLLRTAAAEFSSADRGLAGELGAPAGSPAERP